MESINKSVNASMNSHSSFKSSFNLDIISKSSDPKPKQAPMVTMEENT